MDTMIVHARASCTSAAGHSGHVGLPNRVHAPTRVSQLSTPARPHSPMIGAFPLLTLPLPMKVASRCSMVVLAKAVYWAAVEKLEPP